MRILNSFLTGLLVGPLAVTVLHAVAILAADGPQARTGVAVTIGIACAACSWLSVNAGKPRRIVGALLLIAGGLSALFFTSSLPPAFPAQLAILVGTATTGLCLLGGGRPLLPAAVLGACLGINATEAFLAPQMGLAIPTIACSAILVWVRWQQPGTDASGDPSPRLRYLDLMLAGVATAFTLELFRPIVLQHLSGSSWSDTAITSVVLTGAGLGALFGGAVRGSLLLRIAAPMAFVGAAWLTLAAVSSASDASVFMVNEDTDTWKDRALTWLEPHPRLEEVYRAQFLLAILALAGGFWLRVSTTGGRASGCGAIVFLGMALGADMSHRVLENPAWAETALRADPGRFVRRSALENVEEWSLSPPGLLRAVRDNSVAEGNPYLTWQGRRASRTPMFRLLEEEEIHLAGRTSGSGSLLVYGLMTANHRRAFQSTPFSSYTVAAELPALAAPGTTNETKTVVRAGSTESFDTAVILSTPFYSAETARMVTEERLESVRGLLKSGGSILVWIDLRAAPADAVSSIARAVASVFDDPRAWIALDGGVGPFVAIESGPRNEAAESSFSAPIPFAALTGDRTRIHSVRDPVVATLPPKPAGYLPLANAADLRSLSSELGARGEPEELRHMLESIAVHSENYFPLTNPNDPMERHRVTDEECEAVIKAIHAAPNREIVRNHASQFLVLAAGTKSYERLDRVLQTLLEYHPDDPRLRYASGRSAYDLLDYESAVLDLEISLRENREHIDAYRLLGLSYSKLTPPDHTSAISSLHAALELDSENLETIRALGIVLYDADRKLEAIQYLERAAMSDPTDEEVAGRLRNLRGGP